MDSDKGKALKKLRKKRSLKSGLFFQNDFGLTEETEYHILTFKLRGMDLRFDLLPVTKVIGIPHIESSEKKMITLRKEFFDIDAIDAMTQLLLKNKVPLYLPYHELWRYSIAPNVHTIVPVISSGFEQNIISTWASMGNKNVNKCLFWYEKYSSEFDKNVPILRCEEITSYDKAKKAFFTTVEDKSGREHEKMYYESKVTAFTFDLKAVVPVWLTYRFTPVEFGTIITTHVQPRDFAPAGYHEAMGATTETEFIEEVEETPEITNKAPAEKPVEADVMPVETSDEPAYETSQSLTVNLGDSFVLKVSETKEIVVEVKELWSLAN